MNVQTENGMDIYCLPEYAECKLTSQNPLDMDECPICNFDDFGECCVPGICDEYTERRTQ